MPYKIQNLGDLKETKHPFGVVKEFFSDVAVPDFNIARIKMTDDHMHHHGKTTEVYYILSGKGRISLDGEEHEIGPDTAILIEPGTRHRARAYEGQELNLLVFSIPAYNSDDEFREDAE